MTKKAKQKKASSSQDVSLEGVSSLFIFRLKEGLLLLSITLSIFLWVSLVSYHYSDPGWTHSSAVASVANSGGRAGAWLADIMLFFLGYMAYVLPIILCYSTWLLYYHRHRSGASTPFRYPLILMKAIGFLIIIASGASLIAMYWSLPPFSLPHTSGGVLGASIAYYSLTLFNYIGSTIILSATFFVGVTLFSGLSWFLLLEKLGVWVWKSSTWLKYHLTHWHWWQSLREQIIEYYHSALEKLHPVIARMRFWSRDSSFEQPIESDTVKEASVREPSVSKLDPVLPKESSKSVRSDSGIPRYKKSAAIPKLSLLDKPAKSKRAEYNAQYLEARSKEVEQRLADFGVSVKVVSVYPGPVVTRYEMTLAAGTKVSKISALVKDLARSLSVVSVRIVEVIPGKSVIGLELPNDRREDVALHDVLASQQYENARSPLSLALGKDIAGHPVVVDLAKMPHLLVAGTTGSGKSVSLNAMLLSLLYKASPEQLRMILIDPKMLELAVYDGIPHLLTPVVTDMKDAAVALRWCVMEMERRYRLMASLGVRNIAGYNAKVKQARKRGAPLLDPLLKDCGVDAAPELEELPQIVVIADEFADMMVVVGKKVETLIARLAQKARAAGVHLIFATQRPSVDVITGLIKANIPSRIAFQVSSKIDSRTILDQQGADQLLGYGDMLYLAPGTGLPVRVHGAYVSDDEVHRVVSSLKAQGEPCYLDDVLNDTVAVDPSGYTQAASSGPDAEQDEYYDEAVKFVTQSRKVSISSIQRRFKIGYNRSASIVEAMEQSGVVSSMENNGSREVLAPPPVS